MQEPLAVLLRPKRISDILGQAHLIKPGRILYNLVKNERLVSMILYGKPGIGKTTIALCLIQELNLKYRLLNATINNKKDFDIVIEEAKMYHGLVVIMDEIHRLNKDKQDLLLPYLENGLITLIGMTSANPYHKINAAIRSRCQIFELKELNEEDLKEGLHRAISSPYLDQVVIDDASIQYIASLANGDLRYAYNLLEMAYFATESHQINMEILTAIYNKPAFFHDQDGDGHYDVLSAFQKSIRGSDVNASLHYLARLLLAEDLDSLYRRMSVIAYEDIGLANPDMGPRVEAAIAACERLGLPEGQIPLSSVVIQMALSPKSNSAELAIQAALEDLEQGKIGAVPNHIKTISPDYRYPHDYPYAFVKQQYLPDQLLGKVYYHPKMTSKKEQNLKKVLDNLTKLRE